MQIKALHKYDCLRANKSTYAWGLEARVPFLDKKFIDVAMGIDPENKMVCIQNVAVHYNFEKFHLLSGLLFFGKQVVYLLFELFR